MKPKNFSTDIQTVNDARFQKEELNLSPNAARPLLAWMSYIKPGDFLLLTPSLIEIQNHYPSIVMAVPDLLWDLYCETNIFEKAVPASEVESYLSIAEDPPMVLDLTHQDAFQVYFPELALDLASEPFMDLDPDENILNRFDLKPFHYFTVHSGDHFVTKNETPQTFETAIEIILERNPEMICVNVLGPNDPELFEDGSRPAQFKTVRTDLREMAHVIAGSLFHMDNETGIDQLAWALDVPSVGLFESNKLDCDQKLYLTSLKPTILADRAQRILKAYGHLEKSSSAAEGQSLFN